MVFATKNTKALNREDDLLQNMAKNKEKDERKRKRKRKQYKPNVLYFIDHGYHL
jgi:hypothetical protein